MGPHGEFRASGVLVGLFVAALWFAGFFLPWGLSALLVVLAGFPRFCGSFRFGEVLWGVGWVFLAS